MLKLKICHYEILAQLDEHERLIQEIDLFEDIYSQRSPLKRHYYDIQYFSYNIARILKRFQKEGEQAFDNDRWSIRNAQEIQLLNKYMKLRPEERYFWVDFLEDQRNLITDLETVHTNQLRELYNQKYQSKKHYEEMQAADNLYTFYLKVKYIRGKRTYFRYLKNLWILNNANIIETPRIGFL